jgi:hypothetical protein
VSEDWEVIKGAHIATPLDLHFEPEEGFDDLVTAMKDLTFATQTVTFQVNDLTASFIKLLTGGWVFWWGAGAAPMSPGMVTWDGRRRRHRRKRKV